MLDEILLAASHRRGDESQVLGAEVADFLHDRVVIPVVNRMAYQREVLSFTFFRYSITAQTSLCIRPPEIQGVRTKSVTLKGQNAVLEYQYKSEPGARVAPFLRAD